ncbi:AmmeMemoRadiSam system radical SAM enzyme [Thermodesulfobacterium sp. TA1]|uniref:AmmeMemoRadiSam system radical SAM enzyme n=1 Tax=Thermodesulfobacterium sp. TA1 TaxID=2234087 RepID=UPI001232F3F6|nr:AmmeMemoRadiSam system radical SAM enzyme [Thermodesulfobacterium sp. TA1]QER41555.1 AmmeMemoRadiSam system radical SAM enzyme [Thermodesulfobacterium sp. TA1]
MRQALFYKTLTEKKVQCNLCNHRCIIPKNGVGLCGVRKNEEGILYSLVYGKVIAQHLDPIEKKPLYHFLPRSWSYSIATVGCNFRCTFCQNFEISQYPHLYDGIAGKLTSPKEVVERALKEEAKSISYTYTEPTVFFEFAYDCAKLASKYGLKNVFVSNGYMSKEAIDYISPYLHGINVDLKSFRENFYRKLCKAKLQPVLDNLKYLKKKGIWVEITTLIIPGENDDPSELRDMAIFIKTELDENTPWHLSRFYPQYQMLDKDFTPIETLQRAYEIGKEVGLNYVYIGNVPGNPYENTYCPKCQTLLIERRSLRALRINLQNDGLCPVCGFSIAGIWH